MTLRTECLPRSHWLKAPEASFRAQHPSLSQGQFYLHLELPGRVGPLNYPSQQALPSCRASCSHSGSLYRPVLARSQGRWIRPKQVIFFFRPTDCDYVSTHTLGHPGGLKDTHCRGASSRQSLLLERTVLVLWFPDILNINRKASSGRAVEHTAACSAPASDFLSTHGAPIPRRLRTL